MIDIAGYRVLRELGRGGMATVHVAEQRSLGREVALKVLKPQLASAEDFTARFLREGRIAASLHHRHIVAIHDVGVQDGSAYLAMEYLPRGTVAGEIGRIAPRTAMRCIREIAQALDYAHARGIVHRDVKPENILQHEDGAFLLSDFGIAYYASGATALTAHGTTLGTPAYMSPEQWRSRTLDGRADLYSLGIVMFELLTGTVPYSGNDGWDIGMQHMQAPLPLLPPPFEPLQGLLARLLAKDPAQRAASGSEVAAHIESLEREGAIALEGPAVAGGALLPLAARTSRLLREWPHVGDGAAKYFDDPSPPLPVALRAPPAPAPAWRRAPRLLIALLLLPLALAGAWLLQRDPGDGKTSFSAGSEGAIAVLPCENWVVDRNLAYFGDGLAQELIQRLSRLQGLRVIGRQSSFAFKGQSLTAAQIGERLGAAHVLSCSVRDMPGGIRISAELIDVASDTQRWASVHEQSADAGLQAVDSLAVAIAEQLLANLVGADRAELARHQTTSLDALRQVDRAWQLLDEGGSAIEAEDAAQRALTLDPRFAAAEAALAAARFEAWRATHDAGADSARIRAEVEAGRARAVALDPQLPEAALLQARLALELDRDWSAAEQATTRALSLAPNAARVLAAALQLRLAQGRAAEALALAERLRELEPFNPAGWRGAAFAALQRGDLDAATREIAQARRRFPQDGAAWLLEARIHIARGECDAAAQSLRAPPVATPDAATAPGSVAASGSDPGVAGALALADACAGRAPAPAVARADLALLDQAEIAWAAADREAALAALQDAAQRQSPRDLAQALTLPSWTPLRAEPRFAAILASLGLPQAGASR